MAKKKLKTEPIQLMDNPIRQQCFDMLMVGFTFPEISERTGIPEARVRQWSVRGKWTDRRARLAKLREERYPTVNMPMVKAFGPDDRDTVIKTFNNQREKVAARVGSHVASLPAKAIIKDAPKIDIALKFSERALGLDRDEEQDRGHISLTFLTGDSAKLVRVIEQPKLEEHSEQ